jgi:hypothetical protein
MAQKITRPFVEKQLERLNTMTGMPLQPYLNLNDGNGIVPQAGNYHLDSAYNGWEFCRMASSGSGAGPVIRHGHVTLREVSLQIECYVRGIEDAKQSATLSA